MTTLSHLMTLSVAKFALPTTAAAVPAPRAAYPCCQLAIKADHMTSAALTTVGPPTSDSSLSRTPDMADVSRHPMTREGCAPHKTMPGSELRFMPVPTPAGLQKTPRERQIAAPVTVQPGTDV
ncbi:hypothetical protein EVAR_161_1 [Eumeta japonica]|uniref:Secreted protein n=1 Tax=Eumeta variegata TaxID=151549 RepID=A0A4C1SC03_EUMVA|nr:hypothetical protein EVAR_161_1 [Eumeta japonica]